MKAASSDRRSFLTRVGTWAAAAAAVVCAPACELFGSVADPDDDFGMHGPVRINQKVLEMPASSAAADLFEPYQQGEPFSRRWAVGHVARGPRDQVVVLLVDTESGGHAEFDLYRRDPSMQPVAHSEAFGVYVDNDGRGDVNTPVHLERLATRLAEIIRSNEGHVTLGWRLPSLREANTVAATIPEQKPAEVL